MSIISISATKAQKDGAKYLFGPKGESILAVLEGLAKAKELRTPHLSGLILMLKDAEDDELIKFKASPAGKRTIESAKALATAKTLVTSIKALRGIKINSKWVQNHDDVKASGAEETKTHRATGKPTKPQKGDTLVNPQAPEAETVGAVVDRRSKKAKVGPGKTDGKSQATLVDELSEMQPRKFIQLGQPDQYAYMKALKDMVQTAVPNNSNIQVLLPEDGVRLTIGNGKRKTYQFYVVGNNWMRHSSSDKSVVNIGSSIDVAELIQIAHETANTSSLISMR